MTRLYLLLSYWFRCLMGNVHKNVQKARNRYDRKKHDKGRVIYRSSKWIAVELKPSLRTLRFFDESAEKTFSRTLAFPYTQLIIDRVSGQIHISFTNTPVKSIFRDKFYYPPLPNVNAHGAICGIRAHTVEEACVVVFGSCWTLYGDMICKYLQGKLPIESYADWEDKSKNDSTFITKVLWGDIMNNAIVNHRQKVEHEKMLARQHKEKLRQEKKLKKTAS